MSECSVRPRSEEETPGVHCSRHLGPSELRHRETAWTSTFLSIIKRGVDRDAKPKLAYIAVDFDAEMMEVSEGFDKAKTYELLAGKTLIAGRERIRCPEVLSSQALWARKSVASTTPVWC